MREEEETKGKTNVGVCWECLAFLHAVTQGTLGLEHIPFYYKV